MSGHNIVFIRDRLLTFYHFIYQGGSKLVRKMKENSLLSVHIRLLAHDSR